jgi:predicted kinase
MVSLNAIGGDDVDEHIDLFAWSAITAPINTTSTPLPLPISCSTITSDPNAEFITLPNAIRNLSRHVKNPAIHLSGGDCAMQEIIAEQESGALSSTVKPFREPPMLVVLCGPSHAGKTTFAQRISKTGDNFEIISPDKIRKQLSIGFQDSRYESRVWDIYESMKRKALEKGCNVVLDACHITEKARWHALQGPNQHHRKICVVFDLPLRTVMERCDKDKRVSSKEVRRMWQAFQHSKPSPEELIMQGFDEVYFRVGCRSTHRQRCFIFHHLRARPRVWFGDRWYKNREVNYGYPHWRCLALH